MKTVLTKQIHKPVSFRTHLFVTINPLVDEEPTLPYNLHSH